MEHIIYKLTKNELINKDVQRLEQEEELTDNETIGSDGTLLLQ